MSLPAEASRRRVRLAAWIVLVATAVLHAWATRFEISPDGLAYLDLADAWARGDAEVFVNAYWSPAYPTLLGLVFALGEPSPAFESTLVRGVDLAIFVVALVAFERFWRALRGEPIVGYALFGASCLALTNAWETTPDLLSAAVIFFAASLALRLVRAPSVGGIGTGLARGAVLGLLFGLGYLVKLAILGPALVAVGLLALAGRRRAAFGALVGLALVVTPWAVALSLDAGRPTLGEAGRLNLAWYVLDEGGGQHWRGEGARHPTRLLHDDPPVHGFAGPIAGTYPPWLDPAHWHAGLRLRFAPLAHARVAVEHVGALARGWLLPHGLLWLAIVALAAGTRRAPAHGAPEHGALLVVALVAILGYLLVHVELRFLGPWAVLLGGGLLGRFDPSRFGLDTARARRLVALAALGALLPIAWTTATLVSKHRDAVVSIDLEAHDDLRVARGLRALGVENGERIAAIGDSMDAYWARLAGLSIVAEVFARPDLPGDAVERYWRLDAPGRRAVDQAMASEGAVAVVTRARELPPGLDLDALGALGWRRIEATEFFVRDLRETLPRETLP